MPVYGRLTEPYEATFEETSMVVEPMLVLLYAEIPQNRAENEKEPLKR